MDTEGMIDTAKATTQAAGDQAKQVAEGVSEKIEDIADKVRSGKAGTRAAEPLARFLETQTARLPADVFLWGAFAALCTSATLQIRGRNRAAMFVGQWTPTLLLLGLYSKRTRRIGMGLGRLDRDRRRLRDDSGAAESLH